jgi:hypothetical protein
MVREIKFRAWEKPAQKMHYEITDINWECEVAGVLIRIPTAFTPSEKIEHKDIPFEDCELMQFTGLHAKGKELYRSEIVRITSSLDEILIGEVVWDEEKALYAVDDGYELLSFENIINCEHLVEIISNIHENPELAGAEGAGQMIKVGWSCFPVLLTYTTRLNHTGLHQLGLLALDLGEYPQIREV